VPTRLAPGIREKRPGYFEVLVYAGIDPKTGRSRYASKTVRGSVRDANAARAELLTNIEQHVIDSRHTVAGLFDRAIDHLETLGGEPSTIHSYRSIARRVSAEIGRVRLTKLRADHLDRVYAARLRSGPRGALPPDLLDRCARTCRDWARSCRVRSPVG
jgi:hypothetical protein